MGLRFEVQENPAQMTLRVTGRNVRQLETAFGLTAQGAILTLVRFDIPPDPEKPNALPEFELRGVSAFNEIQDALDESADAMLEELEPPAAEPVEEK